MKNSLCFLLLLQIVHFVSYGQKVTFKNDKPQKEVSIAAAIIEKSGHRLYAFNGITGFGFPGFFEPNIPHPNLLMPIGRLKLNIYDSLLNLRKSLVYDDFKPLDSWVIGIGDKLFAISRRDKKVQEMLISEVDPQSGMMKSPSTLFAKTRQHSSLYSASSPDKKLVALINLATTKEKDDARYQAYILDENGQRKTSYEFTVDCPVKSLGANEFILGNDGDLYFLYRNDTKNQFSYSIAHLDAKGQLVKDSPLNTGAGISYLFAARVANGVIECKGLGGKNKKEGYDQYFSASIDASTLNISLKNVSPFSSLKFNSEQGQYDKYLKDGVSPKSIQIQSQVLPDGSAYYVLEDNSAETHEPIGTSTAGERSVPQYETGDLAIFYTSPDGRLVWMRAIRKRQIEFEFPIYTGCVCTTDAEGALHIFFMDEKSNDNADLDRKPKLANLSRNIDCNLARVMITRSGKVKKDMVLPREETDAYICPGSSVSIGNGNIFYLAASLRRKGTSRFGILHIKE